MNKLLFLVFSILLVSCSQRNNFSKQKFTDLKPLTTNTWEQDEFGSTITQSNWIEDQESDPEHLYTYHELELRSEENFDFELEVIADSKHKEVIIIDPPVQERIETITDSTRVYRDEPEKWFSDNPTAKKARGFFWAALACLAGLITGIILLFTSAFVLGAGLMFLSFVIGYGFLIASRSLGNQAKGPRNAKVKKNRRGQGDKIIYGLALAGLIGFGIGALPLALMALVGAFGWYA